MSNGTSFIAASDLYNLDAPTKDSAASVPERIAHEASTSKAPAFSWLALVVLFVAFGILYEMSELST